MNGHIPAPAPAPDAAPLSGAEFLERYRGGQREFPQLRLENAVQLAGAELVGLVARSAVLVAPYFQNADLRRADLSGSEFQNATCFGVRLNGALLDGAHFKHSQMWDAKLGEAKLRKAHLYGARLERADLRQADLSGAILDEANLEGADLSSAILKGCSLKKVHAAGATLHDLDLRGINLAGADLRGADLERADLRDAIFDTATQLDNALVDGAKIDRATLESLQNYGGLSKAARATMVIVNDVAELRQQFSGFMQYIHVAALVLFFSPYVWFVASIAARAQVRAETAHAAAQMAERCRNLAPSSSDACASIESGLAAYGQDCAGDQKSGCETMAAALWHYAWTSRDFWARVAFCFYLLYNLGRLSLLWKTKRLEHQEIVRELPAHFSLEKGHAWRWLYAFVHWGFFFNVCAVLYHTWEHLLSRVPIS